MPEVITGALFFTLALSKGLKGHIQADFIAVFKAIRNGFSRAVDLYRHALNRMGFNPFMK
jgi:hypothetical protein